MKIFVIYIIKHAKITFKEIKYVFYGFKATANLLFFFLRKNVNFHVLLQKLGYQFAFKIEESNSSTLRLRTLCIRNLINCSKFPFEDAN